MATILLVEDAPDLGLYEANVLESHGHRVLRCSGTPTPLTACTMMRSGSCSLVDSADVILFSCAMVAPVAHRGYRGSHLLHAYRSHPVYGRLPMVVVSVGLPPGKIEGSGPLRLVQKFSSPDAVIAAVEDLVGAPSTPAETITLDRSEQPAPASGEQPERSPRRPSAPARL